MEQEKSFAEDQKDRVDKLKIDRSVLLNLIEFTRNSGPGYGITAILEQFLGKSPTPLREAAQGNDGDGWIEFKEGQPLPDYDEYVMWLNEARNVFIEALDKDGNPWLYGGPKDEAGYSVDPKVTHWRKIPPLPGESKELKPSEGE